MLKKFLLTAVIAVIMGVSPIIAQPTQATRPVGGQGEPTRVPYNIALGHATRNLPAITTFDTNIRSLEDMRTQMQDMLNFRQRRGESFPGEIAQLDAQIGELTANIHNLRLAREMATISTELTMRNSMTNIANTELDILLLEANIGREQVNVENTRLRFEAGMVSESDLNTAELALEQMDTDLASLQVSLATERQNLNRILQRQLTGNYYIMNDWELLELPSGGGLDEFVRRTALRQPTVRQRDIAVGRARAVLNQTPAPLGTFQRSEQDRALAQAEREYNTTLRAVETAIRNQYNNLTMLLNSNESLGIDLLRANERLNSANLNFQVGRATQFEIDGINLEIFRIETAIQRNLNNFWNAQFMLENAFLLG
ncbi:MAG: TolC family protein [Defluviitaleaceae bacterium]|nr:TolC family protein [Defluviitaleaceae bacterium]